MSEQNPILDALQVSVIVNRRDQTGQVAWTEWRNAVVVTGGTSAQAGNLPILGSDGKLDPSIVPGGTASTVSINGTTVSDPNFNNTTPAAPGGFTNVLWQSDGSGNVSAYYATSGVVVTFGQIEAGDNTNAAMTVSGTAVLEYSGSGVVNANEIGGIGVAVNTPDHVGQILISQPGNTTAAWADPLVQGLYPAGSSIASPPVFATPTTIQPVLVGGQGTSPSGRDGLLHALPLTQTGQALFVTQEPQFNSVSGGIDPYQRDRVSTPITLFEESYEFFPVGPVTTPPIPTQFTFLTAGSGAFNRPSGFAQIQGTVSTDAGARAVWQTKTYFISQLGKGFGIFTTGNLGVNIANVITRIGAYDDDRGGFFEQNGQLGVLRVIFRANGSDANAAPQSAWNIDKLDGTGSSGITLNMANGQAFTIDVGAGRVRFGFIINGITYFCHSISAANNLVAVAHAQSVVPVRFEIFNTAVSAGGSISQSNVAVISDGGFEDDPSAFGFSINTGTTLASITTPVPILSIRPALLLNGFSNRSFITLRDFGVFSLGQVIQYQLVWNGVLSGASFASVDPVSGVEYDVSATAITGGRVVDSGFIAAFSKDVAFSADKFPFRLPFTLDITGTVQDVYTLVASGVNGSSAMVGGSFKWQEAH